MLLMLVMVMKSKDVERTVGINCRYLGALQNSQLSKQDRLFLIEVSHNQPCSITFSQITSSLFFFLKKNVSELISHYLPSRSLRPSNTNLLTRPAGITSNFSSRAFSVFAPSTWNFLPAHIRSIDTLSTFKRHVKFNLFQSAFTV